ncbi:MAG: threonine synthase, partial [Oscillospiraceae bacterium]|nr:threonine synthase [Oscillospiraceae bacterium]
MKYYSTRNREEKITASQAIIKGLASDGGLYVPECFPQVNLDFVKELCALDYRERAAKIMSLFLEEFSEEELLGFCREAYSDNYDCTEAAPVRFTDDTTAFLELWHGPTCAFKDMALQMLPRLLTASLRKNGEEREVCILVATSGDTGKAALEGFADVGGTRIFVFYPRDGVSDIQKLQMVTQKGGNVGVCSVIGNFDDAQSGVQAIFSDKAFAEKLAQRGFFL